MVFISFFSTGKQLPIPLVRQLVILRQDGGQHFADGLDQIQAVNPGGMALEEQAELSELPQLPRIVEELGCKHRVYFLRQRSKQIFQDLKGLLRFATDPKRMRDRNLIGLTIPAAEELLLFCCTALWNIGAGSGIDHSQLWPSGRNVFHVHSPEN